MSNSGNGKPVVEEPSSSEGMGDVDATNQTTEVLGQGVRSKNELGAADCSIIGKDSVQRLMHGIEKDFESMHSTRRTAKEEQSKGRNPPQEQMKLMTRQPEALGFQPSVHKTQTHMPMPGTTVIDITTKPKCLVSTGGEGDQVNSEEDVLMALAQRDKPAVVIGIAGKYRSGKSYLMNRLAGKKGGFSLGSTIQSHTKGIWVWVMDHPTRPDLDLILLDTEGLGDVEKSNDNHDNWIFCLTLLLSSTLVFNVMGVLDKSNIDMLNLIIELSKRIKTKEGREEGEDLDFDAYCPNFVMAHRDFTADLEANGKELTPNEYLEHCLKLRPGGEDNKVNDARLHIRKYFKRRACFVFGQPAIGKKMRKLESLPENEIDEDFVEESTRFINFIYNACDAKSLHNGKPVNGRILAQMLRIFVESIKRGDVPCIEGAINAIAIEEDQRIIEQAIKIFNDYVEKITLPKELNELEDIVRVARKLAMEHFEKNVIRDQDEELHKRFMGQLENLMSELTATNMEISKVKCRELIEKLANVIELKLQNNWYFKVGGHLEYLADEEKLKREYLLEKGLGEMKLPVLQEFLKPKELLVNMIKKFDEDLFESQQKASQLSKENRELEFKAMKTEHKMEKLEMSMESKLQLADNNMLMTTMAHSVEMEEMKQKMIALKEEQDRKIQEEIEEKLHQEKLKNAQRLIEDYEKALINRLQRDDERQDVLDVMREAEINKLLKELRKEQADQLQEEKDRLQREYKKLKKEREGKFEKNKGRCSLM